MLKGKKILFVASSYTFCQPIMDELRKNNELYSYRQFNDSQMKEARMWADLTWLEWCDALAIRAAKFPTKGRTVCRLHSYEAFSDLPKNMDWNMIHRLILVAKSVGDILDERKCIELAIPRDIIPNGLDINKFHYKKKIGKNIAFVGYINNKKGPETLIQCLLALKEYDPEYCLHIAGAHQDSRIQIYMNRMITKYHLNVVMHGWVDDIASFYDNMDYVISTSMFESFHYALAEGILCGCTPLIYDWQGACDIYDPSFVFSTPKGMIDIINDSSAPVELEILIEKLKKNHSWSNILNRIDRVLEEVSLDRITYDAEPLPSSRNPWLQRRRNSEGLGE